MSYRSGHRSDHHYPHDHGRAPPRRPAPHAAAAVLDRHGYAIVHAGKQVRFGPVVFWIVVGTIVVLGISADSVKAQESFRDKHRLSVPLISDEKHEMLEAYGAWGEKSMYGRSFMGIIRTTVLIAADGRIAKIWRNVRVDGHADEVLAAVREG